MRQGRIGRRMLAAGFALLPASAWAQWRSGHAARRDPDLPPDMQLSLYARDVAQATDDLARAVEYIDREGVQRAPPGVLSRTRAWLLDRAQRAWIVAEQVPPFFEESAAIRALDREAPPLVNDIRDLQTPAPEALHSARRLVVALRQVAYSAQRQADAAAR